MYCHFHKFLTNDLITLQGLPPAITSLGIFFTTTLPAAIIVLAPILTPLRTIVPVPMNTSFSIIIGLLTEL